MGLTSLEKTPDLQFFITLLDFATKLVKIMINKVVVGSGHRDVPKYMGRVWHHTVHPVHWVNPFTLITSNYGCFGVFSRRHALDVLHLKHVISFVDVTSFNDTMT